MSNTNAPSAPDFTDALPVGSVLWDYTVMKVLGQGGFGITYLALDAASGKEVVLKENLPAMFALRQQDSYRVTARGGGDMEENFRWATENFLKEARLLASLNHPNIVPVLKAFSAIGTAFYVMPWMGGMDLTAYVRKQDGVDGSCLTRLLIPLLHALSYLHSHNLLHRDIKPGNILCSDDGTPILIDFGTARAMVSERSQTVVESAGYTPMEQMQSHGNTGPWTDLYALGATCYKLITGETPPRSTDRIGESDSYIPLSGRKELRARYSHVFLESVDKAMGIWPKQRWQSADEWLHVLQSENNAEAVSSIETGETKSREVNPDTFEDWDAWKNSGSLPEFQYHSISFEEPLFQVQAPSPYPVQAPSPYPVQAPSPYPSFAGQSSAVPRKDEHRCLKSVFVILAGIVLPALIFALVSGELGKACTKSVYPLLVMCICIVKSWQVLGRALLGGAIGLVLGWWVGGENIGGVGLLLGFDICAVVAILIKINRRKTSDKQE